MTHWSLFLSSFSQHHPIPRTCHDCKRNSPSGRSEEFIEQVRARLQSLQRPDDVEKLRLALLHEFADNRGIAVDDGFSQLNAYRCVELDSLVSKRDGSLVRFRQASRRATTTLFRWWVRWRRAA